MGEYDQLSQTQRLAPLPSSGQPVPLERLGPSCQTESSQPAEPVNQSEPAGRVSGPEGWRGRVRYGEAWREAWRNVLSGTSRALQWGLLFALIVAALAWADTSAVSSLVNAATGYLAHDGATWALQDQAAISGAACETLGRATGISSAGAVRANPSQVTSTALPTAPVPLFDATPGFLTVLGLTSAQRSASGLIVSSDVAARYGLSVGSLWATSRGRVRITGIYAYPDDGRLSELEFAAIDLVPALSGSGAGSVFDECWVTGWPTGDAVNSLVYTALIHSSSNSSGNQGGPAAKLIHVNSTLATSFDGFSQFNGRLTRWVPLAALLFGLLLGFITGRIRWLEFASALHAGIPRLFLLVQSLCECLMWLLPALCLAAVGVFIGVWPASADNLSVMLTGSRSLFAAGGGVVLGLVAAVVLVQERQLFKLFKTRG